jgi:uncharacterized protein YuzE
MQIRHDREGDAIRIKLNNKKAVDHIEVIGEVVVIGVDANGEIVDISILDASKHVPEPSLFEYIDITTLYKNLTLPEEDKVSAK